MSTLYTEEVLTLEEIQALPRSTTLGLTSTPVNIARIIEIRPYGREGNDSAVLLFEGGKFAVCNCPYGVPANILLSEGLLEELDLERIMEERARRKAVAETERVLTRSIDHADRNLQTAKDASKSLPPGVMQGVITRLEEELQRAKDVYKAELGKEYEEDIPF